MLESAEKELAKLFLGGAVADVDVAAEAETAATEVPASTSSSSSDGGASVLLEALVFLF